MGSGYLSGRGVLISIAGFCCLRASSSSVRCRTDSSHCRSHSGSPTPRLILRPIEVMPSSMPSAANRVEGPPNESDSLPPSLEIPFAARQYVNAAAFSVPTAADSASSCAW